MRVEAAAAMGRGPATVHGNDWKPAGPVESAGGTAGGYGAEGVRHVDHI